MTLPHVAIAVLVAAVWGFNFVVSKVGLDHYPPFLFTALRFCLISVLVFFVPPPRLPLRRLVAIGLIWFLAQFGFMYLSLQAGMPPGLTSVTVQAQTIFTVLIAAIWQRELPTVRQLAGLSVAVAGLCVIAATVGGDRIGGAQVIGAQVTWAGLLLSLACAFSWSLGNVLVRESGPVNMFSLVVWGSVVPALPAFGLSLVFEGWPAIVQAMTHPHPLGIGALAYVAVASTLVGFALWGHLLSRYPAGAVAPFSLLVPPFGALSAALVLGERFTPLRLWGMALILAGLVIVAAPFGARRKR